MAMYKSLFDLSPEQTASTAMPRTVVFSNGTGSGSMTICPLFSGAELYYNDMHLVSFDETPALARNVIEINHCRVGRYECSFGENSCCYLAAGDFAVCAAARKKSSSCFPLRHYHGITILLDLDAISPEMRKQMEWYGVDLDVIRRHICTENRCCILRSEPTIAHIFSELYTAHSVPDTTQRLTVHQTIEQLAQDVGLSATALKTCFKGVYGSSVYAYQKEYRLQLAQKLLTETDSTIAEIAHQIGYENPNKFSSAFRQSFGMTPTQYRKMRPIG
ncbi:MAG: helix-turn-helix transcriptional regulator [Faecalibacterium prausnitzii]|nr:helix-turn-helix transcriptional regulator [Faecalibacterium prausnitzii]